MRKEYGCYEKQQGDIHRGYTITDFQLTVVLIDTECIHSTYEEGRCRTVTIRLTKEQNESLRQNLVGYEEVAEYVEGVASGCDYIPIFEDVGSRPFLEPVKENRNE